MSLNERTKLKGLLEVVSSASEFEDVPIRHHEDILLKRIYDRSPVKLESQDYESPHFKTFVLLQAHFSRMVLPADLASDQAMILGRVIGLLSACVDVMSSNAYLSALGAMDLSQMCVQAMWETDSPLKQIPHFDAQVRISSCRLASLSHRRSANFIFPSQIISRCKAAGVESVYDITELEDDQRNELLTLDTKQMFVSYHLLQFELIILLL
jgi:pre-mRNA-splicing helicase BRR2